MATQRRLKLGIIGLGVAGSGILPAVEAMPQIELVAAADVSPRIRAAFEERYHVPCYEGIEQLCANPEIEAVWVSTPNKFHAEHTVIAAQHGKHVSVEKPMAVSLEEAERMIDAAERNHVQLLCGRARSSSPAVQAMLGVVRSGELGRVCALHTWSYTDWMLRPRLPDEVNVEIGGGVAFRQAPHQVDTIRLLAGGMVKSVRAMTGQWMPERPNAPGYYSAYLEFEDGTPATIVYNGYGYFLASELVSFAPGRGRFSGDDRFQARQELRSGQRNEEQAKDTLRFAGSGRAEDGSRAGQGEGARQPSFPSDLGLLIVSCERGDMRHSPTGIYVYDDQGLREIAASDVHAAPSPELAELYDAAVLNKPVSHGGRWGIATLEVCLAIMQSAQEHREIQMRLQCPAPREFA